MPFDNPHEEAGRVYRGTGFELRDADDDLINTRQVRGEWWRPVREIPKADIERDLEFKTKNNLALLQRKVQQIRIDDAERPVLDARVRQNIPEMNITRASVYAAHPESADGLVAKTDAQEQDDATHMLLEINQLLKLGHFFAAERRLNRELTPEERANRSLSGPLLPINSGTTGFSVSQAIGQVQPPMFPAGAKMPTDKQATASSKESQTSSVDTGEQKDSSTEMMTPEEMTRATGQQIADAIREGVISIEVLMKCMNDELKEAVKILNIQGRSHLKTKAALAKALNEESIRLEMYSDKWIPPFDTIDGEDGGGLGYGMRKNPQDKYALLGHIAISMQKLNRDKPILSITYARSGAQVAHYPNQHVSTAFRDVLKSKLQGHEPNLSKLIPLERELYHKLMTLVSKGHLRSARRNDQPIHSKYSGRMESAPSGLASGIATNIHDPKNRLMILLGEWNAGNVLSKAERTEAQALAQNLLQSQALSQEQYQRIVDTLSG